MAIAARTNKLYAGRRRRNNLMMGLACAATLFGLGWLVLILGVLVWEGFSGLSLQVFTEMTPPPAPRSILVATRLRSTMTIPPRAAWTASSVNPAFIEHRQSAGW